MLRQIGMGHDLKKFLMVCVFSQILLLYSFISFPVGWFILLGIIIGYTNMNLWYVCCLLLFQLLAVFWFLSILGSCCNFLTLFYIGNFLLWLVDLFSNLIVFHIPFACVWISPPSISFWIDVYSFTKCWTKLTHSILVFAGTVFVLLYTLPVLYEKYEDKIDSYAEKASIEARKYYAIVNEKYLSKIPRGPLKGKKSEWVKGSQIGHKLNLGSNFL